ncbi:MAG: GIY-YIG nuclease family protein [Candidatus Peribacteraceae bacterium]
MYHVYILRSVHQSMLYVGSTSDIDRRLKEHNEGRCISTKSYKPFELVACISFPKEKSARGLEKYFKTGSGRTILKKRILNDEDLAKHEVLSEA